MSLIIKIVSFLANDTFDAINKRELELGTFAMTSLIYLFDKYGIGERTQLD